MTRRQKNLILFLILLCLIFKDTITAFFIKEKSFKNIENNIYNIEKQELLQLNNELQNQYGYTDFYAYNLEHSKILYKTPYNYNEVVTIYKGINQGILKNQLVINEAGLVGIITKVYSNTSEVTLLNNKNTKIPVKINNSYGTLKVADDNLLVTGLKLPNNIAIGDEIYTSDISMYPQNILIGTVKEIQIDNYEIAENIIVLPAVNFNDLDYVSIITTCRGETCS